MSLVKAIGLVRPDEVYNLAAQSHVQVSFDVPEFTADVDATGVLRVLEAVRVCGLADTCRIYQASTFVSTWLKFSLTFTDCYSLCILLLKWLKTTICEFLCWIMWTPMYPIRFYAASRVTSVS